MHYRVVVNGYKDPDITAGKNYMLVPGNKGVDSNDLEFRQFSHYLSKELREYGYEVTNSTTTNTAIILTYGMGNPVTTSQTSSMPVYGQVSGGSTNFNAMSFGPSGTSMTFGNVYSPPQYGVVGTETMTSNVTVFPRYAVVDAVDLSTFRSTGKIRSYWRTIITSVGSSADLRRVFPAMIAAASNYFDRDTGKQVSVTISEYNSKLKALREK